MSLNATRMRLPLSLDAVTPDWLTQALDTRFPGVRVASATRDQERSGTSTSARFALTYAEQGGHADLPASIYVKGGFDDVMRNRVWAVLIQEARFYAELAPEVPVNIPLAYFAGVDEEAKQGVIILEDMTQRGVRFGHVTLDKSLDTVAATMEGLGKLHAKFWNDPRLPAYRAWADPQRSFLHYLLREKHWNAVHERVYGDMLRQVFPDRAFALAALTRLYELNDRLPHTLCHGDPHSGNMFYEPDGAPGFLDWQLVFPGAPGHDHAEMMMSSLTTDGRRKHERDLIALYRNVLVASGVADAPSFDDLFLSYRQNQMHNMTQSVFNPYDMQSQEVTDMSAIRSLHAAIDLDMVEALGMR
ncbi:MAG: phosphotransferase [Phenylobacterium sp.]|uniref:phosphotransferase n=1 Tax=Phenylobacterium sp. TaxID=1871053 RepID=UPI0027331721|nr:phosphotransferase [Phenylobacterium sp.]MDP3175447.1 phosphotransferase [Phenylobacterium sp.]